MRLVIILIFQLFFSCLNAQAQNQAPILKGNVENLIVPWIHLSYRIYVYQFDRKKRVISKRYFKPINNILSTDTNAAKFYFGETWSYDDQDNIILETIYGNSGIDRRTAYKYYSNIKEPILEISTTYNTKSGKIEKIDTLISTTIDTTNNIIYSLEKEDNSIVKLKAQYNKAGNLVIFYREKNPTTYANNIFNASGKLIQTNSFSTIDSDTSYKGYSKYKYDKLGNLILSEVFNKWRRSKTLKKDSIVYSANREKSFSFMYSFRAKKYQLSRFEIKDQNGNILEAITYDNGKKISSQKYSYVFDTNGNKLKVVVSRINENNFSKTIFKYDYDKNHNWTSQYRMKNGKWTETANRVITYFK